MHPPTAIVPIVIWKNNGEDVQEDITGSLKSGLFHLYFIQIGVPNIFDMM